MDAQRSIPPASTFGLPETATGGTQPPLASLDNPIRFNVLPPGSIEGCRPKAMITVLSCRVTADALRMSGWISGGKDFGASGIQLEEYNEHVNGIHEVLDGNMWTICNTIAHDSYLLDQSERDREDNSAGIIIAADAMTIFREIHEHYEGISKALGGSQFNPVHPLFTDRLKGERPSSEADLTGQSTKLHLLTKYPFGSDYLPSFESLEFERPVQQRPVIWENPNGSLITMIPVNPDAQELRTQQETARKHQARFERHKRYEKYQKGGVEASYIETEDTTFDSRAGGSKSTVPKLKLPSARKFARPQGGKKIKTARARASSSIVSSADSNPPIEAPLPPYTENLTAEPDTEHSLMGPGLTSTAQTYGGSEQDTTPTPVNWFARPGGIYSNQPTFAQEQQEMGAQMNGFDNSSPLYQQTPVQGPGIVYPPPQSPYPPLDSQGGYSYATDPYPQSVDGSQMPPPQASRTGTGVRPRRGGSRKGKKTHSAYAPYPPQ